jgi:hypothetical protein
MAGGAIQFIVYEASTGYILRTGVCPTGDLKLQQGVGEVAIEGVANDMEHKIKDGKIVNLTQQEIDDRTPDPVLPEKRQRIITREEYDALITRIGNLEKR